MNPFAARGRLGTSPAAQAQTRVGCRLVMAFCAAALSSAGANGAHGATELDRDAYWIESAICSVSIRSAPGAGLADPGAALGALATAPANCTGNLMAQVVPGGVNSLLLRGFRIIAAHHQVLVAPARPDGETALLVTALFALERPALKPPPIPK